MCVCACVYEYCVLVKRQDMDGFPSFFLALFTRVKNNILKLEYVVYAGFVRACVACFIQNINQHQRTVKTLFSNQHKGGGEYLGVVVLIGKTRLFTFLSEYLRISTVQKHKKITQHTTHNTR